MTESRVIWKYDIQVGDVTVLDMPLWAMVEPDNQKVRRRVYVVGTGHAITEDFQHYIGTIQTHGGMLVWHAFDCGERT